MKYLIVIEKTKTGFSAYSPDLDGCIATGKTRRGVLKLMREGIPFHLEGMAMRGQRAPKPTSSAAYIEVDPPKPEKPMRRQYDFSKGVRGALAARFAQRKNGEASHARKRP